MNRFKAEGSGIVIEFQKGEDGKASAFKIVEGGPPITFQRKAEAKVDPFVWPLFVRGSMNGWGTSLPLAKGTDGALAVEMPLEAGDY